MFLVSRITFRAESKKSSNRFKVDPVRCGYFSDENHRSDSFEIHSTCLCERIRNFRPARGCWNRDRSYRISLYDLRDIYFSASRMLGVRKIDKKDWENGRTYFIVLLETAILKRKTLRVFPRNLLDEAIKVYYAESLYKTHSRDCRSKTNRVSL